MNRQMVVKWWSNSRQIEFGMEWNCTKGTIYSIPQMTGYLTRTSFNCQTK
jgi:hypothetical protein